MSEELAEVVMLIFDERREFTFFSADGYYYRLVSQRQRADGKWVVHAKLMGRRSHQ